MTDISRSIEKEPEPKLQVVLYGTFTDIKEYHRAVKAQPTLNLQINTDKITVVMGLLNRPSKLAPKIIIAEENEVHPNPNWSTLVKRVAEFGKKAETNMEQPVSPLSPIGQTRIVPPAVQLYIVTTELNEDKWAKKYNMTRIPSNIHLVSRKGFHNDPAGTLKQVLKPNPLLPATL